MLKIFKEENLRKIFDVGVVLKGIDGFLELLGAFFLFLITPEQLSNLIVILTQNELSEDPKDFIATHLVRAFEHYSLSTKLFESAYLFIHGLIKIFLVWGLLKNKLWAYPSALAFLAFFMAYQTYRYFNTNAVSLIILTVFDLIIFILTWHEYNFVKKHRNVHS